MLNPTGALTGGGTKLVSSNTSMAHIFGFYRNGISSTMYPLLVCDFGLNATPCFENYNE
jgi:hypothetical protein